MLLLVLLYKSGPNILIIIKVACWGGVEFAVGVKELRESTLAPLPVVSDRGGQASAALEKEFLIRCYRSNQRISIKDFCESNGFTEISLKKWMKQYDEGGLEGLARADAEIKEVLPEGVDRTEESYKREILKLRIENERLKKVMPFR